MSHQLSLEGQEHADVRRCERWIETGKALLREQALTGAAHAFRAALDVRPYDIEICRHLLCTLELLAERDEAVGVWYQIGEILRQQQQYPEAVAAYRQALARKPDCLRALIGLAHVYLGLAQPREAIRCLEAALVVDPEHPDVHLELGSARHLIGDAEGGWNGFRWYYNPHKLRAHNWEQPLWDGLRHDGKTILLWTEMGRGDVIQFLRYIPFVADRCARVVVQCNHSGLLPLIERISGVSRVVVSGAPLPQFDLHAPLLFFPALFPVLRSRPDRGTPYLTVDPDLRESWRRRLRQDGRRTVGISWGGNAETFSAASRFISLEEFAPLGGLHGVRLISLQHGPQAADLRTPPQGLHVERLVDDSTSIDDAAALIANLDLVISVDTMIAHLAGALKRPVWILLRHATNWRWGLQGEYTPWYPTMRLFRQPADGSWSRVFERVRTAIETESRSMGERDAGL